uniref:Tryptophan synthase beta chain-like PALP domain-containing protein n=1 Tax=Panagrolaimus davidi TaxID=227884 RepID=A0A914PHA5_9BILA
MILEAEKAGTIDPEKTVLVEVTSGNTGIGLASIAAAKGYKLIIVMPSACSLERRTLLRAFGAELVLTARAGGIVEAIKCAEDIHKSMPNSFFVNQLGNPANPNIHYETTGPEIWKQTQGKVDAVVIGIGTGGTIMGTAKEKVFEKCITVKSDDAIETAKRLAREERILSGISGGANIVAAIEVANLEEMKGKLIVTCIPSFGERYLSTPLYSDILEEVSSLKEKPLGEALDPDYFNFKCV